MRPREALFLFFDHHFSQNCSAYCVRSVSVHYTNNPTAECNIAPWEKWQKIVPAVLWLGTNLSMHAKAPSVCRTYWGNLAIVPRGCSRSCGCGRCLLSRCLNRCCFPQLPVGLQGGKVVDGRKLDQGREDEGKAHGDEPIHGRGIRNFWEGVAGADTECCHSQDGSDTCMQGGDGQTLGICFISFLIML